MSALSTFVGKDSEGFIIFANRFSGRIGKKYSTWKHFFCTRRI